MIYFHIGYPHEADDYTTNEEGEVDEHPCDVVCVGVLPHPQHVLHGQDIVEQYFLKNYFSFTPHKKLYKSYFEPGFNQS